jgi:hypothetical protein
MSKLRPTRLLGFAPIEGLDALQSALKAVPGPALWVERGEDVAALVQAEPHAPLIRRGRKALLEGLHTVQRRLEVACQSGPFLPMDPAAATCPTGTLTRLLSAMWPALSAALHRHGRTQQWDVVLRWSPEAVVAAHRAELAETMMSAGKSALAEAVAGVLRADRARREAALLASLSSAVLAIAPPIGTDTEVALTVLVRSDEAASMEAALESLSGPAVADASLDLRGPLPALSFFAVRLATVEQGQVASAWRRLDLPERIDLSTLHRQWRQRAAALHPDRWQGTETLDVNAVSDVTEAYRTLRSLLPGSDSVTLADLLSRAGYRLVLPVEDAAETTPDLALRVPEVVT